MIKEVLLETDIKEVLLETDIKEVLSENEEFSWDILDTWHKNLSCVEE